MNSKSLLALAAAAFTTVSAFADNKLYIEDFSIPAGETKEIAVMLDNDDAVYSFQFNIALPEGLTMIEKPMPTERINTADGDWMHSNKNGGTFTVFFPYYGTTYSIDGNSGAVATFKVKAANDAVGECQITLFDTAIALSTATLDETVPSVNQEDTTVNVTIEENNPYIEITTADSITIAPGSTASFNLALANEVECSALTFRFNLPEGITVESLDRITDRCADSTTVAYKEETGITVLASLSTNIALTGYEGDFLTVTVAATEDFAEDAVITIDRVYMSDLEGLVDYVGTGCTINVIALDEAALAEAARVEANEAAAAEDEATLAELTASYNSTAAAIALLYPTADVSENADAIEAAIADLYDAIADALAAVAEEGEYESPLTEEAIAEIEAMIAAMIEAAQPSGISAAAVDGAANVIYDLNGLRVNANNMQSGKIYIINGTKVLK